MVTFSVYHWLALSSVLIVLCYNICIVFLFSSDLIFEHEAKCKSHLLFDIAEVCQQFIDVIQRIIGVGSGH